MCEGVTLEVPAEEPQAGRGIHSSTATNLLAGLHTSAKAQAVSRKRSRKRS